MRVVSMIVKGVLTVSAFVLVCLAFLFVSVGPFSLRQR